MEIDKKPLKPLQADSLIEEYMKNIGYSRETLSWELLDYPIKAYGFTDGKVIKCNMKTHEITEKMVRSDKRC